MIYLVIGLTIISAISLFYCIRFGIIILRVQDALEESLDVIDEKFMSMSEVCERPLFYDSPEVRQVLEDIKETRSALHQIAYSLSKNFELGEETEETEETEERQEE